jgi:CRP-like cAMP-binding protein/CheY-like chemotaxis protein
MEQSKKVLVVEDEAIVAMDIEASLRELGYQVTDVVDTGEGAMKKADENRPDLVLMDIKLKGETDGITAAGYVRDKLKLPVVFLTSFGDEATLRRAKVTLPYGYILKPYEQIDLRTAIELALHRHESEGIRQNGAGKGAARSVPIGRNKTEEMVFGTDKTTPFQFLKKIEPFNQLPERDLSQLANSCSFYSFESGDSIAYEGEEDASGFIVAQGRIAMLKSSLSGKELIVELLPPGDIFGLLVALESMPYPLTARAQIPSKVLWVPKSNLHMLLEDHPELYRQFTQHMSTRLRSSHDISRGLAYDRVEVRIAATLTNLVPKFARTNGNEQSYAIDITRQELADLTGTSPETAIRITKAMEREGLLDLSRPCLIRILNLDGLKELFED